jgi:hypothetical protein
VPAVHCSEANPIRDDTRRAPNPDRAEIAEAQRTQRIPYYFLCALCVSAFLCASLSYSAEPAYRTDGGNEKLPWFQLKHGEFPPEGSAHYISGELIGLDHINRTGVIRLDRTDAIRRGEWDHPLPFTMLPYGSIGYHGAPAELRDIPIGTHLHGQFYVEEKAGKGPQGVFDRCIRLEDDFSYFATRHRFWRIDGVDLEKGTLTVTGVGPSKDQTDSKPAAYQVNPATRVWKGHAIVALADLAPGESVLLNSTYCTLKGPGRITDIWIDTESRDIASAHQVEVNRQFIRDHGLAAWVEEVDNQQGIVTATLFAGFDPKLLEGYTPADGLAAAVAEENLRTYDQGSDRMKGEILEVKHVSAGPGNSGIRIRFKPVTLLEGFRPTRIVRLFSGKYKMDDIPKEERIYQ